LEYPWLLILPRLIPIIFGGLMPVLHITDYHKRNLYVMCVVSVTSVLILVVNFWGPSGSLVLGGFGSKMSIGFKIDDLSRLFSFMLAILWPLASVYAFGYMRHDKYEMRFYAFYTVSYGITLAIAYSANFLTIYLFYELLTLVTLPLVIHNMNKEAFAAGRKYIYYSIGGAALIFICLAFLVYYGDTLDFRLGGVFSGSMVEEYRPQILQAFTIAFVGVGVKAALFPLHGWLPSASVAPVTVTALLHAVAVVKSGAFVAMRLTYYLFDIELLWGTWAQYTVMGLTIITILYGSARAFYTSQLKLRLAYSTVSQLSYTLFAITLMTWKGLAAAMMYMLAHGFIKILLFYCCGSVLHVTHRYEISELGGLGRRMPITFATFTIGALALMGLPLTAGFTAKFQLLSAATQGGSLLATGGVVVIFIAVLLSAAYLFPVIRTAYFPKQGEVLPDEEHAPHDPGLYITVPLRIIAGLVVVIGIAGGPLLNWISSFMGGG